MRKILVLLTVAALLLCAGCDLIKTVPAGTSSVYENSSEVTSSFVSTPVDTSSVPSVTDTNSRPQSTTSNSTPLTESVTVPTSSTVTSSKNESTVTVNPYAENPCYSAITSEQQRIYRIMLSAVKNVTTDWIWLGNCSSDYLSDIAVAYRAVTYDYPELFWVPYTYVVNKGSTGVKLAFELTEDNSQKKYLVEPAEVEQRQAELDAAVYRIISDIESIAKTPYQKVLYLHDLLIDNITYSSDLEDDMVYTVYGALVNRNAVCEGYAKAMSYICKKMGIECILVTGHSKDQGHMWNLVKLEDKWYHIDVTWDDAEKTIDNPLHTYFCLTDEQIKLDHTIDPDISSVSASDKADGLKGYNFRLPECTATKYNYFEQKGYFIGDDLAAAADFIEEICRQNNYIEFKFATPEHRTVYEAKTKEERDRFLLTLQKNVVSPLENFRFDIVQYAQIGDCLYVEWALTKING